MKIVKPLYYIYCITNQINGKTYVGRSIHSSEERDRNYFGSGPAIKRAIKKYGKDNFKKAILIDNISTKEEAIVKEEETITLYKNNNKAEYNMMEKGYGNDCKYLTFSGLKHTEEHKKKMSEFMKQYRKEHKRVFTEEQRKHISEYGKKHSSFLTNNPSVKGMKWYTDGVNDIMVLPNKEPPAGYYRGRSKTKGRPAWNSGTAKPKHRRKELYTGKYTEEEIKARVWLKGRTPWNKGLKGVQVAWNKGLKMAKKGASK